MIVLIASAFEISLASLSAKRYITYPLIFSISGGADAAKFTINSSTGVLRFVAPPDFEIPTDADGNNRYDVIVRVTDGTFSDAQAIAVSVTPINDNTPIITSNGGGPVAIVNVAENTTAVTTVTATDGDRPAQTLTYSIVGGTDAAQFTINNSTGSVSFVVAPNFEAPRDVNSDNVYDVIVQASDGSLTQTQTLAVTVLDVFDFIPLTTADTFDTNQAVPLTVTPNGVLANDRDLNNYTLTTVLVAGPAHGGLTFNADGSFSYRPVADFSGQDTFVYQAMNGIASSANTVVTINVRFVANAPQSPPPIAPAPVNPTAQTVQSGSTAEQNTTASTTSSAPSSGPSVALPPKPVTVTATTSSSETSATAVASHQTDVGTDNTTFSTPVRTLEAIRLNNRPQHGVAAAVVENNYEAESRVLLAPPLVTTGHTLEYTAFTPADPLWKQLDQFQEQLGTNLNIESVVAGSVGTVASGFTVGYVLWVLRSGFLLSSMLASMPTWTLVDPLSVVSVSDDREDEDGESLEQLVEKQNDEVSKKQNEQTT